MNQSNKREVIRDSRRKVEEKPKSKSTAGGVNISCAFHPSEKITNFCTNRECLLPLCPKCVKIHAEQHVKMGIFGQFDTINESLVSAEEGLKATVSRLGDFQKVVVDVRQSFDSKISAERKVIREAKNYFMEEIQRIFDGYEKAMMAYQQDANLQFFQQLYGSQEMLTRLSEQTQKALRRLSSPQTTMQAIINYYSQIQETQQLQAIGENLSSSFPQTLILAYEPSQLDRLQSIVKRYLDAGNYQDQVWEHYRRLFHQEEPKKQKKSFSPPKEVVRERLPSVKETPKRRSPPKGEPFRGSENVSISQLSGIEGNLNLARFKSPLDKFSLSKRRQERSQF